jgi:hypothetical protein
MEILDHWQQNIVGYNYNSLMKKKRMIYEFSVFIISIGTNSQRGIYMGRGKCRSLDKYKSSLFEAKLTHESIFIPSNYRFFLGVVLFRFHQFLIFVKRPFDPPFFYLLK